MPGDDEVLPGNNLPPEAPAGKARQEGEVMKDEEEEDEGLPVFLCGDDWSPREQAHAYALYLGLPAERQPSQSFYRSRSVATLPPATPHPWPI